MQLVSVLIDVVGPVFLVALVGYIWARTGQPLDAVFVATLVNTVGTPCLVIDTLTRSGLSPAALGEMALGSGLVIALAGCSGFLLIKWLGERQAVYLPSMTWSNGGNMGLPLCLFAFGERGLALAIGYFAVSSISNYTLGQAIAAGGLSWREVLRMPIVWAIALALLLIWTGMPLPGIARRAVGLLGGLSVPLMLLSLGYSLAKLRITSWRRSAIFATARLLGGFAIGLGVAAALGLDPLTRGVLVIQSAMPSAVLNYLFAVRYDNDPDEVAGLVVLSTLMALPLLPVFLTLLMRV